MGALVLAMATQMRAAPAGGGRHVGEDTQPGGAAADLGGGALAGQVAVGVGLELAVGKLVAAEALARVLGAGVGEAVVGAEVGASR